MCWLIVTSIWIAVERGFVHDSADAANLVAAKALPKKLAP